MRRRSLRRSVTAAAAGIAARASSAATSDQPAARFRGRGPLLLDVGAANGGWWDRAADDSGDRNQGDHVRKRLEERRSRGGVHRKPEGDRRREAEEERRAECSERTPVPEDERRERDEAAPGGHILVVGVEVADGQV